MRAVLGWWRWESSRRIEVTPFIRFLTVERFVKATLLILGGLALIVAGDRTNLHDLAERVHQEYNLSPGRHLWLRLAGYVLDRFGGHADLLGVGAILYGLLEGVEGLGLLWRRRWAEYLVLLATGAFLPVEVDELVRHATVFKALALLLNLVIMGYLVWRKRLFLERPGVAGQPA